jgi:hypothetical protein
MNGGTDEFRSVQQKALTAVFKQFSHKEIISHTVTETNHYTEQFTKQEKGGSLWTLTLCCLMSYIYVVPHRQPPDASF